MTLTDVPAVDRRISEVQDLVERIAQNLVSLEDDMTCRILQKDRSLRGRTAIAWTEASEVLTRLWQRHVALADVLTIVQEMRRAHRTLARPQIGRLSELLEGASVSVPSEPISPSSLTSDPNTSTYYTIDDLVTQMSADYDIVARTVRDVALVWVDLVPRLAELELATTNLQARYDAAGIRRTNELSNAQRSISETEKLAHEDPLAVDLGVVVRISDMLERATSMLVDQGLENQGSPREQDENRRSPEIEVRDELRGLLSAYVAKARASGYGEDIALDRIRREASDVLYTTPCDLERAKTLIGVFKDTLSSRTRENGR